MANTETRLTASFLNRQRGQASGYHGYVKLKKTRELLSINTFSLGSQYLSNPYWTSPFTTLLGTKICLHFMVVVTFPLLNDFITQMLEKIDLLTSGLIDLLQDPVWVGLAGTVTSVVEASWTYFFKNHKLITYNNIIYTTNTTYNAYIAYSTYHKVPFLAHYFSYFT